MQARYLMIAERLVTEVAEGKYPVGKTLPAEAELCSRFGVARNTVRQALRVLQDMGLVAPHRGIGTIVRATSAAPRYVHTVESLSSLFEYLQETELHVRSVREFSATDHLSTFLRCREAMRWFEVSAVRTRRKNKLAISFSNLYVPEMYGRVVAEMNGLRRPTYSLLEHLYGKSVTEVDQQATVDRMPSTAARELGVRTGSPAQIVDRHYLGATEGVLLASRSYYPPGRFTLSVKLRLTAPGSGHGALPKTRKA